MTQRSTLIFSCFVSSLKTHGRECTYLVCLRVSVLDFFSAVKLINLVP